MNPSANIPAGSQTDYTPFAEDSGAIFSTDRSERYVLWRIWDREKPFVMFIGLNPSSANEIDPDPTIKSVGRIAKHNGYGGIFMVNCFSIVSTDPKLMSGTGNWNVNNYWIFRASPLCQDIVFAWGNFKIVSTKRRDFFLSKMFPNAKAIQINKNGTPKHPLYCKSDSTFIPFKIPANP